MKLGFSIINAFKSLPKSMKIALVASVIFHLSFILVGAVGLPYIQKPIVIPEEPLSVEIVDISELRTTNRKPVKAPPKPAEVKPAKVEKEIKAPPKVEAKEPPKVRPTEKPPEPPKEDVKPPEPDTPPPPEEDQLEKPKPEEKPKEEPKEDKKQEQTVSEEDFLSVLKNLQESEPTAVQNDEGEDKAKPEASPLAKFQEKLSASQHDAIKQTLNRQFASCWNLMAGARYAEDIVIEMRLQVNPDRTIQSARITDQWRYNQDSFYRAAADNALRAIKHPNCEVLDVPKDKYEIWKETILNFDPSSQL